MASAMIGNTTAGNNNINTGLLEKCVQITTPQHITDSVAKNPTMWSWVIFMFL